MRCPDPRSELFEVFDDHGHVCGSMPRDEVHRSGCWHRSADVWLFRDDGALLLQQRASDKDLFAGCWDYSVGEHLRPGESFLAGALRGLEEELGLASIVLEPVGGLRRVVSEVPECDIRDRELARTFRGRIDEPVHPDGVEVDRVMWLQPEQLRQWMLQEPAAFTPWFMAAVKQLGLP
ncbi:MAG: NUDIX domain-containing protein [Gammaproteobacteria bacterium]|nr:MAG: NUDIX domain-containing protein [Gammaproteobacteria bacterium]